MQAMKDTPSLVLKKIRTCHLLKKVVQIRYSKDQVIKSEVAFDILSFIEDKGESHASEVAEQMDRDRGLVSEVMNGLYRIGVLEKTKRTRSQYYGRTDQHPDLENKLRKYFDLKSDLESLVDKHKKNGEGDTE